MKKKDLLAIVGPTASYKSFIGEYLVKNKNCSIINFDSRQIYKNYPTLKAVPEFLEEHYLYSCFDAKNKINVIDFCNLILKTKEEIKKKGRIPVLIGGTGFYLNVLMNGIVELPKISLEVQQHIDNLSFEEIILMLKLYDNLSLEKFKDLRRLKRSLGIFLETNKTIWDFYKEKAKPFCNDIKICSLILPRSICLKNIELRLNRDFEKMKEEVKNCSEYDEIIGLDELRSNLTDDEIKKLIFYRTSQYAKRQSAYIRNILKPDEIWNAPEKLLEYIKQYY